MNVTGPIASGAFLLGSSLSAAAATDDFTCTNRSAEISCDAVSCRLETEGFTAMSVSRSGRKLQVCAYSGCWSGALDMIRTRDNLTILHARLEGGQGQLTVSFDHNEKIATMLWGNFAQALNCGEG